ncbi:MAG: Gfo/Idh/MocA family oxidoreductase [Gammaproteobacteria bacterium]
MHTVRWGILGTGRMAATLARELTAMRAEGIELVAVASRDVQKAREFAALHGIPHTWGSAADLAADREVDAVYVATPHTLHHENMLTCLRGSKAVLCEKPFTINAAQAQAVITEARNRKLFVMEAMWTRFLPALVAVREIIAAGAIGRVRLIVGGGAFVPDFDADHYLLNKTLGGGVLLDAGVYLVSLASMVLGAPSRVLASGILGSRGVDEQDTIILDHPDGSTALLYISLRTRRSPDLEIMGESGRICLAAPVFRPARLTVWKQDGTSSVSEFPVAGSGYGYQVREVVSALRQGRTESLVMPLNETLSIMRTMDAVREQVGLRYECESESES